MPIAQQIPLGKGKICCAVPPLPRLKRVRDEAGLSQEDLSRLADVSKPTIVRIEAGFPARASTVRKLARALNTTTRDLVRSD